MDYRRIDAFCRGFGSTHEGLPKKSSLLGVTPSAGRIVSTVTEPTANSGLYKVTEGLAFDAFGNVSSDAVTGTGMTARTTKANWGTTGQFPTVITNPLGQSITLGHDPTTGKLTSQTDPNYTSANPLTTQWAYDGFGRKTQETRTDGTYTTWAYNDCASSGGCLFGAHALALAHFNYSLGGALLNAGTTYFDTVNRPVMANNMMLSGGYNRVDQRYDSLGRVAQQSMPCTYTAVATACTYWTTNSYDVLNRPLQSQRPISATNSTLQTTTYGYAGRTRSRSVARSARAACRSRRGGRNLYPGSRCSASSSRRRGRRRGWLPSLEASDGQSLGSRGAGTALSVSQVVPVKAVTASGRCFP